MSLLRMIFLLCISTSGANAWSECSRTTHQCSSITVQWQCVYIGQEHVQKMCCDSLDSAINSTMHEADIVCQGRLQVSITLHRRISYRLSTNVTFSNAKFSQVFLEASDRAQIHCKPETAALGFEGSQMGKYFLRAQIRNITFLSCGPGNFKDVQAALFFNNKCQVYLSGVHVKNSTGSGLMLISVAGRVHVNQSSFVNNTFTNGNGAGVHLTSASYSKKTEFTHCNFTGNRAVPLHQPSKSSVVNSTKGGGLYVHYRSYSRNGFVLVENCVFRNNGAHWGGGLLAMFDDNSKSNKLFVRNTTFINNVGEPLGGVSAVPVAGAGATVTIYSNTTNNTARISYCNFTRNRASWGGGLMFYTKQDSKQGNSWDGNNLLTMSYCLFRHNEAHVGSAIHVYCSSPATSPQYCNARPVLANSKLLHNGKLSQPWSNHDIADSIVSIEHFPTFLNGTLTFMHNYGSPLHIHETSVIVQNSAVLKFHNNLAQDGGAISLYGSWIAVSEYCKLEFINNRALDRGGAIYSYMTEERYAPYTYRCFIQYVNGKEPWEGSTNFNFVNNTVSQVPQTIYATSILPCVWHVNRTSSLDEDIRSTFCTWKNWKFHKNCTNQIHTAPRNFSSTQQNLSAFPGIPKLHFLNAVDDLGHKVFDLVVNSMVLHSQGVHHSVTDNRSLTVYGNTKTHADILLELEGDRPLSMLVNVSLQDCPPGFWFSASTSSCICNMTQHIYCEYKPNYHWIAYLVSGWCMSYSLIDGERQVVHGPCPFTSGLHSTTDRYTQYLPYLPLPLEKEKLNETFCGALNRKGRLCGECWEDYFIDIFSDTFECSKSKTTDKEWLIFGLVEGLLPLAFFAIILLLHISLTSGPVNGFIFFGQVLTVSLEIIIIKSSWKESSVEHSQNLSGAIVKLYSIWSLDFYRFVPYFDNDYVMNLGPGFKVMHVLVLRYTSALYPLLFLLIAFTVIELHARNCRLLVWLWKPFCFLCVRFRQAWKAQTSIVDAFAAFILLSYVKIVRISLLLVTFSPVYFEDSSHFFRVVNYDPTVIYLSHEHAPFWCLGAFCFLTFGLMPPVLLTLYQFKFFQRCLSRFKMNRNGLRIFMDAYQGCYKDGKNGGPDRRYFGGLYFIFRLVVFAIFDTTNEVSPTYSLLLVAFIVFGLITAIIQPYKNIFYTYLDIFFFSLLAIIMALQYYIVFLLHSNQQLPPYLLYFMFALIIIPSVYVLLFLLYWLCRQAPHCAKSKVLCFLKHPRRTFISTSADCESENLISATYSAGSISGDIPDRLEHSFRYRSLQIQNRVPFESD